MASAALVPIEEYDSDEEPPPVEPEELFYWRMDPDESHSDFVIEIEWSSSERTSQVDTYHVHRNVLSLGPRRSDYFARLFHGPFVEARESLCRITLEAVAARAFPALLDYAYGAPTLQCTTETATALHYLGQYLEMRRLRWEARQYWWKDMCLENYAIYYQHAQLFHDERILQRMQVSLGSEQLKQLPLDSELLRVMDPNFLLTLLQTASLILEVDHDLSGYASRLISGMLEHCVLETDENNDRLGGDMDESPKAVDANLFVQITDASYIPVIDSCVAVNLLLMERRLVKPPEDTLTCLQQRCLISLSDDWQHMKLSQQSMDRLREAVTQLFMTELLAATLANAKELLFGQRATLLSVKTVNSNLTSQLESVSADLRERESQTARQAEMIRQLQTDASMSERRIQRQEEEITCLRNQLTRALKQKHDEHEMVRFVLKTRNREEVAESA